LEISAASTIIYLFEYIIFRKNIILFEIVCLVTYLIFLTAELHMTFLLPAYFAVALLPILKRVRRVSYKTLFLSLYIAIYILIGFFFQDPIATSISFISKIAQFYIFFYAIESSIEQTKVIDKKVLYIALISETILSIYLLLGAGSAQANGLIRLVAGAQPITGNISIAVLPIIAYLYTNNSQLKKSNNVLIAISLILFIWTILSGTRGYILLFLLCMCPIYYDYAMSFYTDKKNKLAYKLMLIIIIISIILLTALIIPGIYEKIGSLLRLQDSIGIRIYENLAELEFYKNSSINIILFGIGIGGQAGTYPEFIVAISKQFGQGMWNQSHYLYDSGALFHNLYANILMMQGILGIIILVYILLRIWNMIGIYCNRNVILVSSLRLYWIGFLMMNYYRWSASCGIGEMIILAIILKINREDYRKFGKLKNNL
jgi:hypothetical protein